MKFMFPVSILEGRGTDELSVNAALSRRLSDFLDEEEVGVHDLRVTTNNIVYGTDSPDAIRKMAANWDDMIKTTFRIEVCQLDESLDDQKTFAVKLAARDLDNDWNVNGNYGVMFRIEDANPNFDQLCVKSVIPMCVRSEILKRPEDYAVADVAIKE